MNPFHFVRVFDCDRDNDIVFMTMELLCGQEAMVEPQNFSNVAEATRSN
jgi:hypothetical protein